MGYGTVVGSGLMRDPEPIARSKGCELYRPARDEITLDLDSPESFEHYKKALKEIKSLVKSEITEDSWPSSSRKAGHYHVVLKSDYFSELSAIERLGLAAILGSDRVREKLNLWRYYMGDSDPARLFKPLEDK